MNHTKYLNIIFRIIYFRVKYNLALQTITIYPDNPPNYQCLHFSPQTTNCLFFGPIRQFVPSKWMETESRAWQVTLLPKSPKIPFSPLSCVLHTIPNRPIASPLPLVKSNFFFLTMASNTSIPNPNTSPCLLAMTDSKPNLYGLPCRK
jgi:hypothetical protein